MKSNELVKLLYFDILEYDGYLYWEDNDICYKNTNIKKKCVSNSGIGYEYLEFIYSLVWSK